ncbi:MAG: hypothetical protein MI866_16480 [Bacteroidales bacterium]|nr:hypothetical protein [Bacteroidales bacterium]
MHLLITFLKTALTTIFQPLKTLSSTPYNRSNFRIATFFIILCLSLSLEVVAQKKEKKGNEGIKPGKRKAVLILSDGRTIQLSANDSLNYSKEKELISKSDTTNTKPFTRNENKNLETSYINRNKKKLIKE